MQLALKANFVQLFQLLPLLSINFYFSYCLHQSPRLFYLKLALSNVMSVVEWILHMVFTTEWLLEVVREIWPEWDLNPQQLHYYWITTGLLYQEFNSHSKPTLHSYFTFIFSSVLIFFQVLDSSIATFVLIEICLR